MVLCEKHQQKRQVASKGRIFEVWMDAVHTGGGGIMENRVLWKAISKTRRECITLCCGKETKVNRLVNSYVRHAISILNKTVYDACYTMKNSLEKGPYRRPVASHSTVWSASSRLFKSAGLVSSNRNVMSGPDHLSQIVMWLESPTPHHFRGDKFAWLRPPQKSTGKLQKLRNWGKTVEIAAKLRITITLPAVPWTSASEGNNSDGARNKRPGQKNTLKKVSKICTWVCIFATPCNNKK